MQKEKGRKSRSGVLTTGVARAAGLQEKDQEVLKNLAGKELKAAAVTKGQAGSKDEKSGGVLEWLGEKARPLISPGLGAAAGVIVYGIARTAGFVATPATLFDMYSRFTGWETNLARKYDTTAVILSMLVSNQLSEHAPDKEAFDQARTVTDRAFEWASLIESGVSILGALGTLAARTGAALLSGIPTGGASIPVVGGASLAISGALTANAVTAYATSGIMNSIANSHSGSAMGAGEAEEKIVNGINGDESLKFDDMGKEEALEIAEQYRKKSPVEIPEDAVVKPKSKKGYEQISYKWKDENYKYEVRWHTKTRGAPEGQGNTYVIERTIPGGGGKNLRLFLNRRR